MAFKICLIGCGAMAFNGHGPTLKKYAAKRPGTELAACCDIVAERAETFAESFNFKQAYTDIEKMLKQEKPDGAVLAVPVNSTARLAERILNEGVPLRTENPPGSSMSEGRVIADFV
jgi:myo-inositol 2-dehydrogenase/D-chiro-inositol 1-dehydrogenase